MPATSTAALWHRFTDGYTRPFHEKYGDSAADGAGDMLDLIEEGAFVATGGGRLQPVSKTAVFREFMVPHDGAAAQPEGDCNDHPPISTIPAGCWRPRCR